MSSNPISIPDGGNGYDVLSANADGSITATLNNRAFIGHNIQKIKELWRKCNGDIDKYKKPIMRELLEIAGKDNFKAIKLYDHLRKKKLRDFHKDAKLMWNYRINEIRYNK